MTDHLPPEEQGATLQEEILSMNERLEDASQVAMSRAFNLGCSISLIPAGLVVIAVFYLFKGSLIGAAFTALVAVLAILAFANLSAYIAKARTAQRFFDDQINPEIDRLLAAEILSREAFNDQAVQVLPEQALLRAMLNPKQNLATETVKKISEE
jgi:hypothetical protein